MESVGLVTSIRSDMQLLSLEENAFFVPTHHSPEHFTLYLLSYHRDRIIEAAEAAGREYPGYKNQAGLEKFASEIVSHVPRKDFDDNEALKIRVVLSATGCLSFSWHSVPAVLSRSLFPSNLDDILQDLPTYRIFLSPVTSEPDFNTRYKTTDRSVYDKACSYLPKTEPGDFLSEILLLNQHDDVMEGSFTTAYFRQSGTWTTPPEISGGNIGVTRRWAIENGLCQEGLISLKSVQTGSYCQKVILSNGVRGFGWGILEPLLSQS